MREAGSFRKYIGNHRRDRDRTGPSEHRTAMKNVNNLTLKLGTCPKMKTSETWAGRWLLDEAVWESTAYLSPSSYNTHLGSP